MNSAPAPAIHITDLHKSYDGRKILDGLSLTVRPGEVYGFLGRNGAGKTTAIRILLGLARADAGLVTVLGYTDDGYRSRVGFVPDVPSYQPWMHAPEFLRFCGRLTGLRGRELEQRIDLLLALSRLTGAGQKIMDFSRGMRQRLGIAQALLHTPDLLILDEPTSALDPVGRRDVIDMLATLRDEVGGVTVFFSTHLLADAEKICDRVGILHTGRLVAEAPVAELQRADTGVVRLTAVPEGGTEEELRRAVAGAGFRVDAWQPAGRSLEDAFLELTREVAS